MSPRIRKPKHPRVYISDPMRFVFGEEATNLGAFKDLPRHEQGVMLLRRLAYLVPRGQTFDPHHVRGGSISSDDSAELAYSFPPSELRDANLYLLTYPWSEIVRAGYVAEAPPGSERFEITAEGWAVVMSYISPVWGGTRAL